MGLLLLLWQITITAQVFLSYGTAYRLTKTGGDNGVSLFGWLFLLSLASLIPGLGIYMWHKYRYLETGYGYQSYEGQTRSAKAYIEQIECIMCNKYYDKEMSNCPYCGYKPASKL